MQVNNYQPSFRAASFDKHALEILSKRLPAGQFDTTIDAFKNKYKDSEFDIIIGGLQDKLNRLDAMISYNCKGNKKGKGYFFRHIEEGVFKRFFSSPKKFLEKVSEVYEKEAVPFAQNGYKGYV